MTLSINKKAYTELIHQDLEILNKNCNDSPELDHIRLVLCNSIDMHYPERKSAHDVYKQAKEQNLNDEQYKELLLKEGIIVRKKEHILCAANHYNDGLKYDYTPKNIESGFVICGRRHHNCICQFAQMVGFPYTPEGMKLHQTEVQGFLTNTDRFVNRKEAYKIAFESDQIIGPNKGYSENAIGLCSEDLY